MVVFGWSQQDVKQSRNASSNQGAEREKVGRQNYYAIILFSTYVSGIHTTLMARSEHRGVRTAIRTLAMPSLSE